MNFRALCESSLSEIEKAIVVICARRGSEGISTGEIARSLEEAGHARVNRSRLEKRLKADKRTILISSGFCVTPRYTTEVAALAKPYADTSRPLVREAKLDAGLFDNAKSYVKNVVEQINVSYEYACYDCAAVMIRRLFETLIVDTFENQEKLSEITKPDGNIHQLGVLVSRFKSTSSFTLSRQTKEAAEHLKDIGDWSAHNRRHRARKSDIDSALRRLRLAASDLLHLAGQE